MEDTNQTPQSERALCTLPCSKEDHGKLEQAIQHWIDRSNDFKCLEAQGWLTNIAYLNGNHFTRFSYGRNPGLSAGPTSATWKVSPMSVTRDKYKKELTRMVDNQLLQPHEETVSLMTRSTPIPYMRPASNRIEDIDAARISEAVAMTMWETDLDMPTVQAEVGYWKSTTGNCAVETAYEETDILIERPKMRVVDTPEGERDPMFPEEAPFTVVEDGVEVAYKYQEQARVWSPFHYSVNPSATNAKSSVLWEMRHTLEDIDYLKEEYGQEPEEVEEDEYYFPDNAMELKPGLKESDPLVLFEYIKDIIGSPERLFAAFGPSRQYYRSMDSDNRAVLTLVNCKPCREYPKGRMMLFAGGRLLYLRNRAKSYHPDYPERWRCLVEGRYTTIPGKYWGEAFLSPLIPLQKQLNKHDGIRRIHEHFLALGQYVYQEGSMSQQDAMDIYPGKPWKVKAGFSPPTRMANDNLPPSVENRRSEMVQAIRGKARINELLQSLGNTSNIRSGSMIELLNAEKINSRSLVWVDHQRFLEEIFRNVLIDLSINLKEEDPELTRRVAIAAREYSGIELRSFTGADLRDNVHIRLDVMSSLLKSPEAEKQNAIDFIQAAGGFKEMNAEEKMVIWNTLGLTRVTTARTKQEEAASRMLSSIQAGDFSQIVQDPYNQDPEVFLQVFSGATMEPGYKGLSLQSKQAIQGLAAYYSELVAQRRQEFIAEQIKLAQLTGGKTGGA